MSMKPIILVALFVLTCPGARAVDRVVHQKGRVFSVGTLILARGEQVVFLNDDTVPHNIMSDTPGSVFDLGSQSPGSATPVSFDNIGDVAVLCAIHPRMQMTITIKN
jgi:plastocyanin